MHVAAPNYHVLPGDNLPSQAHEAGAHVSLNHTQQPYSMPTTLPRLSQIPHYISRVESGINMASTCPRLHHIKPWERNVLHFYSTFYTETVKRNECVLKMSPPPNPN